jgi:PadR family transcriptional regulator AphA
VDCSPTWTTVKGVRELTSTSYTVLGLLCLQPWTAYDLAGQMRRGWRFTWPRARSGIYEEPKKLVAQGLARAEQQPRGRASKTVYHVTEAGRAQFRRWLDQSSAEPRFESEAFVRILFADLADKDHLLRALRELAGQAEDFRADVVAQARDYLETGGPFPQRLHLIMLVGRFINEYVALLAGWAAWAEKEVQAWPDVTDAALVEDLAAKLGELLTAHDRPWPSARW